MSSLPLKVALGDLTALEVAHPTATRSGIIRALVVGTVAKGTPLVVPPFTPPSASTWTTISVDSGTELLVTKAFQINNVKNLSALVFNATPREVLHVVVDGRVVIKDRMLMVADEQAELRAAIRCCRELFARAGLGQPLRLD